MKRRLIVLRHAKSAWDTDAPTDHDRPLNKRGRRDAQRVAAAIVKIGWWPESVISSDSMRTRETWKRMRKKFDKKKVDVDFTRKLYHAGFDEITDALAKLSDKIKTVMVIGHNPGWEDALSRFVGKDVSMTTCNAALLSVDAKTWKDASKKKWKLEEMIRPKDL